MAAVACLAREHSEPEISMKISRLLTQVRSRELPTKNNKHVREAPQGVALSLSLSLQASLSFRVCRYAIVCVLLQLKSPRDHKSNNNSKRIEARSLALSKRVLRQLLRNSARTSSSSLDGAQFAANQQLVICCFLQPSQCLMLIFQQTLGTATATCSLAAATQVKMSHFVVAIVFLSNYLAATKQTNSNKRLAALCQSTKARCLQRLIDYINGR